MNERVVYESNLNLNIKDMHICGNQINDGTYRYRKNGDFDSKYLYIFNPKTNIENQYIMIEGQTPCKCDPYNIENKTIIKELLKKTNENYKIGENNYNDQLKDIVLNELKNELKK